MLTPQQLAAGLGLTLIAQALVGCGSPEDPGVTIEVSASAMSFFSRVESLHASIAGTPQQAAQAETLRQQAEQQDYSVCMSRAGFTYDVPQVNWVHPRQRAYEPSWWATPSMAVAALGIGYAAAYEAEPEPPAGPKSSYDLLSDTEKALYDGALASCAQAADAGSNAADAQQKRALDVQGSLDDTLRSAAGAASFAPTQADYQSCMKDAGILVAEPGKLYDIAERAVARTGIGSHDIRSREYAAMRPKAVAAEVALARADVTCRASVADAIANILGPALDSWLAAYGSQVDETVTGWATLAP
jgi:hypothetical protein